MYLIVLVTVPSEEVGVKIAKELLKEKLAACININKGVRSLYWWEDEIQDEQEALLIIKTKFGLFNELENTVRKNHPYKVPEIVAFPVVRGHRPYLEWLSGETRITEDDPGLRSLSF